MSAKPCKRCLGSGAEPDNTKRAAEATKMRRELGMSLREVAAHADTSAMFVSDLEHGRRGWTGPAAQRVWALLALKCAVRPMGRGGKRVAP